MAGADAGNTMRWIYRQSHPLEILFKVAAIVDDTLALPAQEGGAVEGHVPWLRTETAWVRRGLRCLRRGAQREGLWVDIVW